MSLPSPQPPSASSNARLPPIPPSTNRNRSQSRSDSTLSNQHTSSTSQHHQSSTSNAINPIYVELAYVPGHGKRGYCDDQFFRKIRARYYVFSGVTPSRGVFDSLLRAKATWTNTIEHEVTIIPTYESEALCSWIADNSDQLAQLRIDVAPAANRCSINLADSDDTKVNDTCSAYKFT
ncbi:Methionine aminopeptidase 1B, chloroplastic [Blomia tropicalis]|nr:Methionine aminopeptidase 1B, chloroplastic [Blomia tropicalis]